MSPAKEEDKLRNFNQNQPRQRYFHVKRNWQDLPCIEILYLPN